MSSTSGQLMLFSVAGSRYAVPIDEVAEVIELPSIFTIPGAPSLLHGAINSHGRLLPVVDIPLLCGEGIGRRDKGKVIVFDRSHADMALLVDEMHELRSPAEILEEEEGGSCCTTRQLMFADGTTRLVSCQGLLAEVEKVLAESRAVAVGA